LRNIACDLRYCVLCRAGSNIRLGLRSGACRAKVDCRRDARKANSNAMIQTTEKVWRLALDRGTEHCASFYRPCLWMRRIVIVQHMPNRSPPVLRSAWTQFAHHGQGGRGQRLRDTGQALIAPGNKHLLLKRSGARYFVEVREVPGEPAPPFSRRAVSLRGRYGGKRS